MLNKVEVMEQYNLQISNMFSALENLAIAGTYIGLGTILEII
jgi:hypothetical protein